jgi:MerR family transcriptional regulator, heat shock protein HspR
VHISNTEPIYLIGRAAKFLKVSVPTLRIWEKKGLIKIARIGKNRFFSQCDLDRLEYIKGMLQKDRINIRGVKNILNMTTCWELKKCVPKERDVCPVYLKFKR